MTNNENSKPHRKIRNLKSKFSLILGFYQALNNSEVAFPVDEFQKVPNCKNTELKQTDVDNAFKRIACKQGLGINYWQVPGSHTG